MPLAPLHVHSTHSLLQGVPTVAELVVRAKSLGYSALALTDVNTLAGSMLFLEECRRAGILPILGVELRCERDPSRRLVLLARNGQGYGDLCELTTFRNLGRRGPDLEDLFAREYPNLAALCPDPQLLQRLAHTPLRSSLFGEIILTDSVSAARSREVEDVCRKEGLESAVSHECWFLRPQDHELHRVLRAIGTGTDLSRLSASETAAPACWLLPPSRIRELYARHERAMETTSRLVEGCRDDLSRSPWILPETDVPDGHTCDSWLAQLAHEGLARNYGGRPEWDRARLLQEKELRVIRETGYAGYFLMVREIRRAAGEKFRGGYRRERECSILRGSAANCLTLYNLDASDLDPIRYDLYFERFLNEDRTSPPDADLDFGWDERPKVLDWFFQTYGQDHVCLLSATHHFRRRAAFRETAKVLGFSERQVGEAFQRLRRSGAHPNLHWLERVQEIDPSLSRVAEIAALVQGRPRFLGMHPGGILVTNDPIWRHISCQRSASSADRMVSQIDMHGGIDFLGLVKFDILGNGSLSVLRDALEMLREEGTPDPRMWDLERIQSDPEVLRMMGEGDTRGVFYVESPAQMRLNRRSGVSSIDEVGITSSLVRPAGTAYAQVFVKRHREARDGHQEWSWLHDSLRAILAESHDVCVFQEDVTRICVEVAGLSFAEADRVRKMMNSQHEGEPSDWDGTARRFMAGCMDLRGMSPAQARELWERVASFRGFSFCKSHSLSYAQLSFRCTWLKRHHPAQFWAAVVGNDHGYYPTSAYVDEIRRVGIPLLPWDVCASRWKAWSEGGAVRVGFQHVRGLRRSTADAILAERDRAGAFRGIPDFRNRLPSIGCAELDLLARVGAFDRFGIPRNRVAAWICETRASSRPVAGAAGDLFEESGLPAHLRALPAESPADRAMDELSLCGYSVTADPLEPLGRIADDLGAVAAARLPEFAGKSVRVVGVPVANRVHRVRGTGEPMLFLSLSDRSGVADAIFWPSAYRKFHAVATSGRALSVHGRVTIEDDACALVAEYAEEVRS